MGKFYAGGYLYNPKTGAVLLHLRDEHALINPNKWAFFGGTSEGEEVPKQCFLRELKEELNIHFREDQVLELRHYWNPVRNVERYVFYIETDLPKSKMQLGEGADFEWIPLEKVFEYDLTDKTKEDLEFFLKLIAKKLN